MFTMKRRRLLVVVLIYFGLLITGAAVGRFLPDVLNLDVRPGNEPEIHSMIMFTTLVYIVAAAVPFIPGAEIGFALLVTLGASVAGLVYISMVAALTLAYLVGRLLPARAIAGCFGFLGLNRARNLVFRLQPLSTDARLKLLMSRAPARIVPFLLRHRFVALAVVINLPGNTLLGGGGGIALAAGMSGLYPFPAYLATIAVAIAPLPLLVTLLGYWH
ncbi:hypothetical protein [Marinobacter caseinilyticus]|uniref:hypothetical protein n=1 Tax=Marinobacter caseinilyticus TaxID=2692195 RepID=UPI00140AD8D1|nr:hypothetical protein [Marinobacter caseinilyticus]